ncbi:PE family protein [Mycobacterium riyadhense]|uniref:PE family protein n=1 Tax=Mycobacterium riyadhense TaxID=486698 RepID=UPI001EF9F3E3|nr:PE family protein [Mycobacterium riyadhense]
MGGLFGMVPGAVDLSAAAEAGISEEMAATTAAGAAALTGVMPMAPDADSIEFAAALNAAGAAYLATAAEQAGQRAGFAGAQGLASGATVAAEGANAATLGL